MEPIRPVHNPWVEVSPDIRYTGRAVSYVQYMPAKLIKHGIKVVSLCYACSAVILAFKVYVGKDEDSDGTAVGICNNLCVDAGLTKTKHVRTCVVHR